MVKKIKLDFSKVEERSGWNTRQMPEGLHAMKIVSVEDKEANDGTDMWVFALVPESQKYKTRRFPFYCKLQANQYFKIRDLLVAAGVKVPKSAMTVDPTKVIGKVIAVEVIDATGQFDGRSEANGVYPLDTLDGDDSTDADDEYDEEESDDEEYDSDDDTDDDGDDDYEDEEDEDEDDDDDLDDEDLEDEDEDDEEYEDDEDDEDEEPEPAPRKRAPAKKAPAKKPAAKTAARKAPAKAAPAKRVVKRR
ncbi:hypothetical protein SEA_JEMERALD_36 [Microbacterium phage Jemerald]|nr:hypothetical protein SEA_JUICER_36 [Microbacterium phage Juicer]WNO27275.1 hypothetical protein SEA_JEMERALD_36 [Microbacterium phage Jemerald]